MNIRDYFFTISGASIEMGVSRQTIVKLINSGKLEAQKWGSKVFIEKSAIKELRSGCRALKAQYASIEEATRILNVSRVTIWKRLREGKLTGKKVGREVLISRGQLLK